MATRQMARKKENEFEQIPTFSQKMQASETLTLGLENPNFEQGLFALTDPLNSFNKIFGSRGVHSKLTDYLSKIDSNNISSIKISTDKKQDVTTISAKIPRVGAQPDEIIEILAPGRTSISIWREDGLFANIERDKKTVTVQYG